MAKKLTQKLKREHALEMTRFSLGDEKLVYVLIANKAFSYSYGRKSKIAYIGTTKKGIARVAASAAHIAQDILEETGIKAITARIVTCRRRQKVKTWVKLERAMLLQFRAEYGRVPYWNSNGNNIKETDEFEYFSRERTRKIISQLE